MRCKTAINLQGNQGLLVYTAPAGQTITGVCIKSGSNMFGGNRHSPGIQCRLLHGHRGGISSVELGSARAHRGR